MAFITANGLPWEQDPLYDREKRMLEAQARDEALEAQIRKDQAGCRQVAAWSLPKAP